MENTRVLERNISASFCPAKNYVSGPPTVLSLGEHSGDHAKELLTDLQSKASSEHDLLEEMLMELMLVRHPEFKKTKKVLEKKFQEYKLEYFKGHPPELSGSWVLYNNGTLLHTLSASEYYELRTSRNIGLLTKSEQALFSKAHIAVGGLSVGGLCATTLSMEGFNSFFITDFDRLACSNLNRIQSSLSNIGVPKTDIIAQKIWDIDPFSRIETDEDGFQPENISKMFNLENLPTVAIDAMDSMEAKIEIRKACRTHKIPLVWMIDMGDGLVQIGTERYDLDANYPAFHGSLDKMKKSLGRDINYLESCFSIFNQDRLPYRMADSFMKACNNEGAGISQLAGTVSIAAGAISKVVRNIILGNEVVNEFFIEVDEKSDPEYKVKRKEDQQSTHNLMSKLGLRD